MSHLSSNVKVTLASGLPQTAPAGVKNALPVQINPTASNPSIAVRTVNSSISDVGLTGHMMLNMSNPSVSASGLPTSATPVVVIRSITGTTGGTVSNVAAGSLPSTVKIATVPISTSITTGTASSTTCLSAGSIGQPIRLTTVIPTTVPVIRSTTVMTSTTRPTGNALVPLKTGPPPSVATATCDSPTKLPLVKESVSTLAKASLRQGPSGATSSPVQQRHVIREMQVRVPNRPDKRFSVLRFHSADRLDLSSGLEVFMQRENNLRQFRSANSISDTPERGGAGSEFGRDAKEEARLRKFGAVRESYRPDDQPWLMTVGKGKSGRRRFRGVREGSVSDNVQYFVFCQCKDGNFDAYPVHSWYKMKPEINYRFLRDEEAEIEYNRMHKTMNLFNVMIKRKLTEGDEAGEVTLDREIDKELKYLSVATDSKLQDAESALASGQTFKQRGAGAMKSATASRKLKLTDLEELDVANSDAEEEEDDEDDDVVNGGAGGVGGAPGVSGEFATGGGQMGGDGGEAGGQLARSRRLQMQKAKRKKMEAAARVSRMRRCVKKRKKKQLNMGSSSDDDDPMDEAQDDSELDDHEGDEVDYMTNSSSDEEKLSEEERHRIYEETGVDEEVGLKTLLTDLSSEEEAEDAGLSKVDEDADVKPEVDGLATDLSEDNNQALLDRVKKEEPHEGRRGAPNGAASGLNAEHHSAAAARRHRRKHRRKRKLKLKKDGDDDEDRLSSSSSSSPSGAGGGGGSSSSSSADGGDSSVYTSSSSSSEPSSSDSEPDGLVAKSGVSPDKKHSLLQKLSDSIHAATSAVATTSSVDPAVEGRLGVKRQAPEGAVGAGDLSASCGQPMVKKGRLESSAVGASGTLPAASSSVGADSELKNTVRKYLMRKPITVTELLKKIRLRKLVGKNENPQTALANVLRQLRPIKQIINGQHALSLKH